MLAPRLLVVIAVLTGFAVVAGSLRTTGSAPTTDTPAPAVAGGAEERRETVSAAERGQRIDADVGVPLQLEVTGERTGAVQVGAGGPIDAFTAETPARFSLRATEPGVREIVLLEPRRVIARIRFRG